MKRQNTKHVNKMSERLMKDKRVGRVEDLLLKKGEDAVYKRKLLQEQDKDGFAPKITQMARNLERSGDVFSRYPALTSDSTSAMSNSRAANTLLTSRMTRRPR